MARRIRGERFHDHRDLMPKTGDEVFHQLPYFNEKEQMKNLQKIIGKH